MTDRRQGDRRENSYFQSKKIAISLGTFISIIAIFLVILASILLCRFTYIKGLDTGYSQGYSAALYDNGYMYEYDDFLDNSSYITNEFSE